MLRKFALMTFLLATFFASRARTATLFHWTFDGGVPGEPIVSERDIVSGEIAYAFIDDDGVGDANGIFYGGGNPIWNTEETSADFQNDMSTNDRGYGLIVLDGGVDSPVDLSTLSQVTIEAFCQPYRLFQSIIIRKNNDEDEGGIYYIDTRPGGYFAVRLAGPNDDVTDDGGICYDLPYEPYEWYHVALVWDGNVIKFYVNGEQSQDLSGQPEVPFTGPIGDSCKALGIGCQDRDCMTDPNNPTNTGQMFCGKIDEVRISDEALAPSDFLIYGIKRETASSPDPTNRATNVCDGTTLCWEPGLYAVEHDVYFGTSFSDVNDADTSSSVYVGRQSANCYTPSGLQLDTTYYWRVDEVNGVDIWKGKVWQFTTNDGTAYNPNPSDGEVTVPRDVVLSWNPGCLAVSHDVFFGTDFNDVNDATTSSHPNVEYVNVSVESWDPPGELDYLTVYYWRVDEVGPSSQRWKGKVWSFRSQSAIIDPNMLAWYTLDEGEGETAFDSSGYEHNAHVDGPGEGPAWIIGDGRFGGALAFDDDTDIECPPNLTSTIDDGFSVSVWLKDAYRAGSDNWVFSVLGKDDTVVEAAVVDEDYEEVLWRAGSDSNDVIRWDLDGADPRTLEGWHHWTFVKNEVDDEISIYYDGFLVESNDVVDETLANVRGRQLRFGAGGGHANDFIGKMDDIKVFNKALTAKEVATLFRGGDVALAWAPFPGNFAQNVPYDVNLVWRPGDYAVQHDVYFGTNFDDVNDADTSSSVYKGRYEANTYDPGPTTRVCLNSTPLTTGESTKSMTPASGRVTSGGSPSPTT